MNDEFSFEMQLADKGIDVYMYDPSVKNLNFTKYNFFNILLMLLNELL